MLTQRLDDLSGPGRRDIVRLGIVAAALIVILTAILGADFFPQPLRIAVGSVATARHHRAACDRVRQRDPDRSACQDAARDAVEPQYDYTSARAIDVAAEQLRLFALRVRPVDQAFAEGITEEARTSLLAAALPGITDAGRATLVALTPERWAAVRAEASRVLDATRAGRVARQRASLT